MTTIFSDTHHSQIPHFSSRPIINRINPKLIEILFYVYLIYSNMAIPFGFFQAFLPPVLLLAIPSLLCLFGNFPLKNNPVFKSIFAISFLIVILQVFVYSVPITSNSIKVFIYWPLITLIVESLIKNNNFLLRFSTVILAIVVVLWPMRIIITSSNYERIYFQGTSFDNSNTLALWLGFCCVTFFIYGFIQKKLIKKYILWVLSVIAMVFLFSTVSRGGIVTTLLALIILIPRMRVREIVALSIFVILLSLVPYIQNVFLNSFFDYSQRALEETGRILVWQEGIKIFLNNLFIGIGLENINIFIPELGLRASPHNGFLYIALSSGLFPLIIFLGIWLIAIVKVVLGLYHSSSLYVYSKFAALLLYSFVSNFFISEVIFTPWYMAVLSLVIAPKIHMVRHNK